MPENTEVAPRLAFLPLQLSGPEFYAALEAERRLLMAYLAAFYRGLRAERRAQELRQLAGLWPLAAGLLIGAFAPALQSIVAARAPWAMTAVFPFFLLAGRPEFGVLGEFARTLPAVMLRAQFPLEGLFAWSFLRYRVTVSGVFGQVFCFHALGALNLWLLNGGLNRILAG
ncbi:MAG: hypothetical protein ABSF23_18170 [Terracidiphilus sp.]|jgi:hypothetical protein